MAAVSVVSLAPQPLISSPAKDSDKSFKFIVNPQAVRVGSEFSNGNTGFYRQMSVFAALSAKMIGFVEFRDNFLCALANCQHLL